MKNNYRNLVFSLCVFGFGIFLSVHMIHRNDEENRISREDKINSFLISCPTDSTCCACLDRGCYKYKCVGGENQCLPEGD